MAKKSLKFGNVVTCEHVVLGGPGKPTLVGVYSGDILVPSLPATITMGIYAEHMPQASQNGELLLTLMLGKKSIGKVVANTEGSSPLGIIGLAFVPLTITEDTVFKVVASCDGFANKIIINQKISRGVLPAGHFGTA